MGKFQLGTDIVCPLLVKQAPNSGYTLTIQISGSGGLLIQVKEDSSTFCTTYGCAANGSDQCVFKNIETFNIDCENWTTNNGWCHGTLTMGGTSTVVAKNTTYTLTGDATLYLYDQYCLTGDTIVTMANRKEKR